MIAKKILKELLKNAKIIESDTGMCIMIDCFIWENHDSELYNLILKEMKKC